MRCFTYTLFPLRNIYICFLYWRVDSGEVRATLDSSLFRSVMMKPWETRRVPLNALFLSFLSYIQQANVCWLAITGQDLERLWVTLTKTPVHLVSGSAIVEELWDPLYRRVVIYHEAWCFSLELWFAWDTHCKVGGAWDVVRGGDHKWHLPSIWK